MAKTRRKLHGFFFTLDVSIALILVMTVSILAFAYFGRLQSADFDSALTYSYAQDAANVLSSKGCLQSLACPESGGASPLCATEVLSATPDSVCMDVAIYNVSDAAGGVAAPASPSLVSVVSKQGCTYSSGAVQKLASSFACTGDQAQAKYYSAQIKVWQRGVRT